MLLLFPQTRNAYEIWITERTRVENIFREFFLDTVLRGTQPLIFLRFPKIIVFMPYFYASTDCMWTSFMLKSTIYKQTHSEILIWMNPMDHLHYDRSRVNHAFISYIAIKIYNYESSNSHCLVRHRDIQKRIVSRIVTHLYPICY